VCNSCEKIQPVDSSLTYFELLGLPKQTFDIDTAKLERRYKRLQWSLHPDKSVGKNASEKEFSAEQATLVNRAYGVLKSPLSRANYMVSA
jgi:molecular chaperone HscB